MKKKFTAFILAAALLIPTGAQAEAKSLSSMSSMRDYSACQVIKVGDNRRVKNIFFMHRIEGGTYWLDPTLKSNNVFYVKDKDLRSWGLNQYKLKQGDVGRGTFNSKNTKINYIR